MFCTGSRDNGDKKAKKYKRVEDKTKTRRAKILSAKKGRKREKSHINLYKGEGSKSGRGGPCSLPPNLISSSCNMNGNRVELFTGQFWGRDTRQNFLKN
jgi:hypothetical protein